MGCTRHQIIPNSKLENWREREYLSGCKHQSMNLNTESA